MNKGVPGVNLIEFLDSLHVFSHYLIIHSKFAKAIIMDTHIPTPYGF